MSGNRGGEGGISWNLTNWAKWQTSDNPTGKGQRDTKAATSTGTTRLGTGTPNDQNEEQTPSHRERGPYLRR